MEYRPYYLATEWQKMGHRVTIVASSNSHVRSVDPTTTSVLTEEVIDGIQYLWLKTPRYSGNGVRRAFNIFSFVVRLYQTRGLIIQRATPDVVIGSSTYPLDMLPAHSIARQCSARLIYEVHDLWPLSPVELGGMSAKHPFILLMQWAENYAYRNADRVVSILPSAKTHMVNHGMIPSKYVYVPNGICVNEWLNAKDSLPKQHATELGRLKKEGRFLVGYAGALGIANALQAFIDAANMVDQAEVQFVIVGQGPEQDHLQERAAQAGLKNVTFLSVVSRQAVPQLLQAMDVLYIGLQKKPLFRFGVSPNKLMDYMMAGKPIIHAIETPSDLVTAAQCGLSIPSEDPIAIAKAIEVMMAKSGMERAEMGRRGLNYVMGNHDYGVLARRFAANI